MREVAGISNYCAFLGRDKEGDPIAMVMPVSSLESMKAAGWSVIDDKTRSEEEAKLVALRVNNKSAREKKLREEMKKARKQGKK
jgi:hypothetical protein